MNTDYAPLNAYAPLGQAASVGGTSLADAPIRQLRALIERAKKISDGATDACNSISSDIDRLKGPIPECESTEPRGCVYGSGDIDSLAEVLDRIANTIADIRGQAQRLSTI